MSGPGSLSKRTDGKQPVRLLTGQDYGDREASLAQQQAAPLSATPNVPAPSMSDFSGGTGNNSTVIPYNAPTMRPNEPITQGVDIGPGAGSEVMGLGNTAQPTGDMTALLMKLAPGGLSGSLSKLLTAAQARNA